MPGGPSGAESRFGLPYPVLADTPDQEKDIKQLVEAIAGLDLGPGRMMQAGIASGTDWSFAANIVAGTAELGSVANTGGFCWLPDPVLSGALMFSNTTAAKLTALKPPSLPANGKYMAVAYALTPSKWGSAATATVYSGAEQASLAAAENHPAAIPGGKTRIHEVFIKNNAGTYVIEVDRDRRPWSKGALWEALSAGEHITNKNSTYEDISSSLNARLELTGVPYRINFFAEIAAGSGTLENGTVYIEGDTGFGVSANPITKGVSGTPATINFSAVWTPIAGSYLFRPRFKSATEGKNYTLENAYFSVQEILREVANNGTV